MENRVNKSMILKSGYKQNEVLIQNQTYSNFEFNTKHARQSKKRSSMDTLNSDMKDLYTPHEQR